MQIQLKQAEINLALRQYIAAQGINLADKEVTISFTAGRKEAGISADISIEDQDLPDFAMDDDHTSKIPLSLVQATADEPVKVAAAVIKKAQEPDVLAEEVPTPEVVPAKANSLFN